SFRALCTGEKGLSPLSEKPLYYKNSIIHRLIKGFMIQGGGASCSRPSVDFTKRNGTGGESIYGGTFADEDLTRPLDSEGLLCMANRGSNTNGSQFFITLRDCPHLNGKHVVFGRVIRGYHEVVEKITDVPVDEKDRPQVPVIIHNCGELVLRSKAANGRSDDARHSHSKNRPHHDRSDDSAQSDSGAELDEDRERRHRKKSKHKSKAKAKSKSKQKK
ncbi:predicted protein, partial [Postia placenta Mad-698-R]